MSLAKVINDVQGVYNLDKTQLSKAFVPLAL